MAAALSAIAVGSIVRRTATTLEFEELKSPDGFRKLVGTGSSSNFDWMSGLEPSAKPTSQQPKQLSHSELDKALFGFSTTQSDVVPIASFSDYYCPYCRVEAQQLKVIEAKSEGRVKVKWHEFPILGEASVLAARASIASRRQHKYDEMSQRLFNTPFRVNLAYLEAVSGEMGLDFGQLQIDMASEQVTQELRQSAELARVFVIVGTPAMVVGRTVVYGAIGEAMLEKLISLERSNQTQKL